MIAVSLYAVWAAIGFTLVAVVGYWGHLLARWLLAVPASYLGPSSPLVRLGPLLGRVGTASTRGALVAVLFSLALRAVATERPPMANMWEFTIAFIAAILLFYALYERSQGQKALGAVVQPLVLCLLVGVVILLPWQTTPLVPALQSRGVLAAHVGAMTLAYGALTISFGAAILYLIQGKERRLSWLPRPDFLEEAAFRSVALGFPLLALGIAIGAYWGNWAWGRYWGWDPKETSSLVTWLIYGVYLHLRSVKGWRGAKAAVVLVVRYKSILFTYFGVNLLISGLHSYAGL